MLVGLSSLGKKYPIISGKNSSVCCAIERGNQRHLTGQGTQNIRKGTRQYLPNKDSKVEGL